MDGGGMNGMKWNGMEWNGWNGMEGMEMDGTGSRMILYLLEKLSASDLVILLNLVVASAIYVAGTVNETGKCGVVWLESSMLDGSPSHRHQGSDSCPLFCCGAGCYLKVILPHLRCSYPPARGMYELFFRTGDLRLA